MAWSFEEVASIVNGSLKTGRHTTFAGISTDPQTCRPGTLLVALPDSPWSVERQLEKAAAQRAAGVVIARGAATVPEAEDLALIEVDDPLTALEELAWDHRRSHDVPVIALGGSSGKTSTNDMLSAVLARRHRVLRTEDSRDDRIGVASTLLELDATHDVVVLEMGARSAGDLERMTEVAVPDVAVLLNIGPARHESPPSLGAIAAIQGELFQSQSPFRTVKVANGEDPEVCALADAARGHVRWFSRSHEANVQLRARTDGVEVQVVRLDFEGQMIVVRMAYLGWHQALNAAAAVAAATALPERLPLSRHEIIAGLEAAQPRAGRFTVHRDDDRVLIDDAYDANPMSVEATLASASRWAALEARPLVVILGQINALGSASAAAHAAVGRRVADRGVRIFATLGPRAEEAGTVAADRGVLTHHEDDDAENLAAWVLPQLGPRDIVFVTGSREIRAERVLEHLLRRS